MSRDLYETTVALPDATGTMKALTGVRVSVVPRGAQDVQNSLVDVFASDTGATRGPDPKSGATGTNPMTTTASGSIRFWAEGPFEYDLVFEDTIAPARIADRIGWNAIPAKPGSIPTSYLSEDGGITQKMLSKIVVNQQVPIGGVIEWWRPPAAGSSAVPAPDGYEIAAGQVVNTHDFPGISAGIVLPNLQNVFILGASLNKGDGAGADAGNAATQGPGIRGSGGSNAGRNLGHGHNVPMDHYHSFSVPNHYHTNGSLYVPDHSHGVSFWSGDSNHADTIGRAAGSANFERTSQHQHYIQGQSGGSNLGNSGLGGNVDWGGAFNGNTSWYSQASGGGSPNTATNTTTWAADPGTDFRPQFYGLLRLIKVRRA